MKILSFIFMLFLTLQTSFAQTALETDSFKIIEQKVLEKGKKFGVSNVLVVFDIDNTIMTMPQNFGSDQWFTWQSDNCFGKKELPEFCVTNKFDDLLDVQGQIFALSNMIPTETATVAVIKNLQKLGYKVILLTSRGPAFRDATERALYNNSMDFSKSAIGPKNGFVSTYTPYYLDQYKKYGLTKSDLEKMGNQKPRPVSYTHGIFMTSGLNKGIMLKTLLNKTKSKFKAIIFSDDHEKHTTRMQAIMGNGKEGDVTTFRYSKIDPVVKAFHASDKSESINAWKKLKNVTGEIFK